MTQNAIEVYEIMQRILFSYFMNKMDNFVWYFKCLGLDFTQTMHVLEIKRTGIQCLTKQYKRRYLLYNSLNYDYPHCHHTYSRHIGNFVLQGGHAHCATLRAALHCPKN
jgi:hypothetical protein